jgi:hypothetical protein
VQASLQVSLELAEIPLFVTMERLPIQTWLGRQVRIQPIDCTIEVPLTTAVVAFT